LQQAAVEGNATASKFTVHCLLTEVARTFLVTGTVTKTGKRQVFASAELRDRDEKNAPPFAIGNALLVTLDRAKDDPIAQPGENREQIYFLQNVRK
jgi:hypothetical protein